ncbi:MAG TPA: hypothetical protein VG318_09210 [Actinomycetota bacterium]|nr:hypothetical protein [Actinomycetota bacterium]
MKKKLIALVAAVVAIVPFMSAPASAQSGGALAFECTAQLGSFPSPGSGGTCKGLVEPLGVAAGAAAGVSDQGPYVLVGPGDFEASFGYAEACVANEPPAIGTATGRATITGMPAIHKGELTTASGSLGFSWTRVGLTAAITLDDVSLTFANGGLARPALGVAVAGFAPVIGPGNTCPSGGPLTAEVAGVAAFGG